MQGFYLLVYLLIAALSSQVVLAQNFKVTELDIAPQHQALYEELRSLLGFEEGSYFKGTTGKVQVVDDLAEPEMNRPISACLPWTVSHLDHFITGKVKLSHGKETDPFQDFALNPGRTSEEWLTTFCMEREPDHKLDEKSFKSKDEFLQALTIMKLNNFQRYTAHTLLRIILSAEESAVRVEGQNDRLWVRQVMQNSRVTFSRNLFRYLKFLQNPHYRKVADRLYDVVVRPSSCTQFVDCFDFLMSLANIQDDFVGPLSDEQKSQPIFDAVQSAKTATFYRNLLTYQLNSIFAQVIMTKSLQTEGSDLQDTVLGRRLFLDQESFDSIQQYIPTLVGPQSLLFGAVQSTLSQRYLNDMRFRKFFYSERIFELEQSIKTLEEKLAELPENDGLKALLEQNQKALEAVKKESTMSPQELIDAKIALPTNAALLSFAIAEGIAVERAIYATKDHQDEGALFIESPDSDMYIPNPARKVNTSAEIYEKMIAGRIHGVLIDAMSSVLISRTVFQLVESYHHNLALKYYVNGRLNPTDTQNIDVFLAKIDAALNQIESGKVTPMESADELPSSVQLYAIYFALTKYSSLELYQAHRKEWFEATKRAAELLKARLDQSIEGAEFEFSAMMQATLSPGSIDDLVEYNAERLNAVDKFIKLQLNQHQLQILLGSEGGSGHFKIAEAEMLLTRIPGFESYVYELGKINQLATRQNEIWQRYLANSKEVRYFDQAENQGLILEVNQLEERIVEQRLVLACYGYWLPLEGQTLVTRNGRIPMTLADIANKEFVEKKSKWQRQYLFAVDGGKRMEFDLKDVCGGDPTLVRQAVRGFMAKHSMKDHSPLLSVNAMKYSGRMMMDISAYYAMGVGFSWGTRSLLGAMRAGRAGTAVALTAESSLGTQRLASAGKYFLQQGLSLAAFSVLSASYSSWMDGQPFGSTYYQHLVYGAPIFLAMPLANLGAARQLYTKSLFGYRRGVSLSSQEMAEQLRNYRIWSEKGVVPMSKSQRMAYHALPTTYNGILFGLTPAAVRAAEVTMGKENQRMIYSWEALGNEMKTGLLSAVMFRMIGSVAESRLLPGAKDMRTQRQRWQEEVSDYRGKVLKELNTTPETLQSHSADAVARDMLHLEQLAQKAIPTGRAADAVLREYGSALDQLRTKNADFVNAVSQQVSALRGPAKVELSPLETMVNETTLMKQLRTMGWRDELSALEKIQKLDEVQRTALLPETQNAANRMILSLQRPLHAELQAALKQHGYPADATPQTRLNWIHEFIESQGAEIMSPHMQQALKSEAGRIITQIPQ
jgi:hypothetical protein